MPEFDSMYGASSQKSFDAGKAPKGTYGGGNGAKGTSNKGTITTGDGAKNLSLAASIFTGNWKGAAANLALRFKPKTEKEKSDIYTKKGFDVLNPNEMKGAKYKAPPLPSGGDGMANITLNTRSVASTAAPVDTGYKWDFQAYRKGQMIKANQGQFSHGKRFGPPPKKGPDPQGIDVPLNSIDYFKDLL